MATDWQFTGDVAICTNGDWQFAVDPRNPAEFASLVDARKDKELSSSSGTGSSKNMLQDSWGLFSVTPLPTHSQSLEEVYVRGNDLIARFRQSEKDSYALHIVWRMLDSLPNDQFGIELWLSVQTGLLDSNPELQISCKTSQDNWKVFSRQQLCADVPSGDSSPAALACALPSGSGVWLFEPTQHHDSKLVSSGNSTTQNLRVFGHFMEKGVIRRGRMRFIVSRNEFQPQDIATAFQDFNNSPLPLTA